jgi:hypothetical protein
MTLEEARQVMSDKNHPLHNRYKQNDPTVTTEVNKAFERTFGTHEIEVEKINGGSSGI